VLRKWQASAGTKEFSDQGALEAVKADTKRALTDWLKTANRRLSVLKGADQMIGNFAESFRKYHATKRDYEYAKLQEESGDQRGGVGSPVAKPESGSQYRFPGEKAVFDVQTKLGVESDGVWGKDTQDAWDRWWANYEVTSEPGTAAEALEWLNELKSSEDGGGTETSEETGGKEAARESFRAGIKATEGGDHPAAAEHFDASYRAHPHPDSLFNAARAYHDAGDEDTALERLRTLQEKHPDSWSKEGYQELIAKYADRLDAPIAGGEEPNAYMMTPDKKKRVMDYLKIDDEGFERWIKQDFTLSKGPIKSESSGRYIGVIDLGSNLPADIRYDGAHSQDGETWTIDDLSRKEIRELKLRGEERLQKRELRRERRDTSGKREELQRNRLRRRQELGGEFPRESGTKKEVRQKFRDEKRRIKGKEPRRSSEMYDESSLRRKTAKRTVRREIVEGLHMVAKKK
jgi:tetratricopeptide (TPR) repeat protein